MPQSLANLYIHLIFSTKERFPYLTDAVRPDLHAYMATVLANLNSPAVLINSVADHVHALFNMSRTVTLAQAVEDVKKSSSKWIKTQGHVVCHLCMAGGLRRVFRERVQCAEGGKLHPQSSGAPSGEDLPGGVPGVSHQTQNGI